MNAEEAREVLGIDKGDDSREIKRKYHKIISQFHPDSVGAEEGNSEYIQRAQEINEAYRILVKAGSRGENIRYSPHGEKTKRPETVKREKTSPVWHSEVNEGAFAERNIYLYYSMDIPLETKVPQESLYYQTARGKYMWDPEEEEFPLFLASIRHASQELLEKTELGCTITVSEEDEKLKTCRFQVLAKLFEYLALQYTAPVSVLNTLAQPETIDQKEQKIYHLRARLEAYPHSEEAAFLTRLKPGDAIYPRAFSGNRIRVMDQEKHILGFLELGDDRLHFCVIPLLKGHAAKVKLLVKSVEKPGRKNNHHVKTEIDFYFRLEEEHYHNNTADLNLKIAELLSRYQKYLNPDKYSDLFARLARSTFRSRFHLKSTDLKYIQEKGIGKIRSHAQDFVRTRLAPAVIPNDGKQTPMRGHPVFIAQHATGCCCRGCLYKWHKIPQGTQLTEEEQEYVVDVLMEWIDREINKK